MHRKKFRGKTFLSESYHEGGSISWRVSAGYESLFPNPYEDLVVSEVKITDCSKAIYLDFTCPDKKSVQKRLDKIDCLISELSKCREAIKLLGDRGNKINYY